MALYDCFTFFNEIDLLKIRLRMLDPYVDKFVLVEMNRTLTGKEKPYYYKENENLFEEYKHKIISLQIEAPDPPYGKWDLEYYQRNCIMKGLLDCKNEDIIMIGDLDEIPNPEVLKSLNKVKPRMINTTSWYVFLKNVFLFLFVLDSKFITSRKLSLVDLLNYTPVVFEQEWCLYYFNNQNYKSKWIGTTISKYLFMSMPQKMRDQRMVLPRIKKGGWHFTYFGGKEAIERKLESTSEWGVDYTKRKSIKRQIEKMGGISNYVEWCYKNGEPVYKVGKYRVINKEKSGIPDIDSLIVQFPEFYKKME